MAQNSRPAVEVRIKDHIVSLHRNMEVDCSCTRKVASGWCNARGEFLQERLDAEFLWDTLLIHVAQTPDKEFKLKVPVMPSSDLNAQVCLRLIGDHSASVSRVERVRGEIFYGVIPRGAGLQDMRDLIIDWMNNALAENPDDPLLECRAPIHNSRSFPSAKMAQDLRTALDNSEVLKNSKGLITRHIQQYNISVAIDDQCPQCLKGMDIDDLIPDVSSGRSAASTPFSQPTGQGQRRPW